MLPLDISIKAQRFGYRIDGDHQLIKYGEWYYDRKDADPKPKLYLETGEYHTIGYAVLIPTLEGLWEWAESLRKDAVAGVKPHSRKIKEKKYIAILFDRHLYDLSVEIGHGYGATPALALWNLIEEMMK